jgi:acetyl-CoA synthetase
MQDYQTAYDSFDIQNLVEQFEGDLEVGFNVAEEALYRHPDSDIALIWQHGGQRREITYGALAKRVRHLAAAFRQRGIEPGDRVGVLLPKRPELLEVGFALWHIGAVYVPLFTAFGHDAIAARCLRADATTIFTDSEFADNAREADELDADIIEVDSDEYDEMRRTDPDDAPPARQLADDPFILLFTSGTTGQPKGVPVPHRALLSFHQYMTAGIDLRDDDVFWNIADPGWAYGLYYGLVGPMAMGQTIRYLQEKFDPRRALAFIEEEEITNLAGAPTAWRVIKAEGLDIPELDLRVASSAGEPLSPEVMNWFRDTLGAPVYDHYGQTEIGMAVNNHHGFDQDVAAGSMGRPMPGFRMVVLDEEYREVVGEPGELAVDTSESPLCFFEGYLGGEEAETTFQGDYYLTNDVARVDEDGKFWFASRADDVIMTAGYRIGPSEVEGELIGHPAVAESAVVGAPDETRGEIIVAFVVLKGGYQRSDELADQLQMHVKEELAAHAYPRRIEFVDQLPKTPSGKVQRFELRDRLD